MEILEYIIAVVLFTAVYVLIMIVMSIREVRLGLFVLRGNTEDVLNKLYKELIKLGAVVTRVDRIKGQIAISGIVKIVEALLDINTRYGDHIIFKVSQKNADEVIVDVVGKRHWYSRCSYTKNEIINNEYNSAKIIKIMENIK